MAWFFANKKSESYALLQSFRHIPYNENPTRALALNIISLKCCLPSTDAIDRQEKIHACVWKFKVTSCKHASLKSTRFLQKKKIKVKHFSNRLVHIWKCTCKRNYILTIKWSIQRVSCKREEKNWWKIKNDIDVIILMWYEEAKTV